MQRTRKLGNKGLTEAPFKNKLLFNFMLLTTDEMTKVERKQRRWRWLIDEEGARPQSRSFVHQAPGRGGNTEAMGKLALGDLEGEAPGEREADADTTRWCW